MLLQSVPNSDIILLNLKFEICLKLTDIEEQSKQNNGPRCNSSYQNAFFYLLLLG